MANYVLDRAYRVEETNGIERYRVVTFGARTDGCQYPSGENAGGVLGVSTHAQTREGKSLTVRRLGIALCETAGAVNVGDLVCVADNTGKIKPGGFASVVSDTGTANKKILWTIKQPGLAGNAFQVKFNNPGPSQALSAQMSGLSIQIYLETNGSAVVQSTAQEVIDLINADLVISRFVTASLPSGSDGTGVVTAPQTLIMSGGEESSNIIGIAQQAASGAGETIDVLLTP